MKEVKIQLDHIEPVLNELLNYLMKDDIEQFKHLLNENKNIDLNYSFGDRSNAGGYCFGTLLDISVRKKHHSFIDLLLKEGAYPNILNKRREKAPIHFAVENCDQIALRALLNYKGINVNILDADGSTALHYAVTLSDITILNMLLNCNNIDLNIINNQGKSPIFCAVELDCTDAIQSLLKHNNLNFIHDPNITEIKEYLNDYIPNWENYIGQQNQKTNDSPNDAFTLLLNERYDDFITLIEKKKNDKAFIEDNNRRHTFLQYCCEYGISQVVQKLLDIRVDPNTTGSIIQTPLMIAASKGYVDIVKELINTGQCSFTPVDGETVLHCVVKGSSERPGLVETNIRRDHLECLSLLLTASRYKEELDINQGDFHGNTALHYAVKQGENQMVLCLLKSGASINCFNKSNEPAFADINNEILKEYLDYCINANDKFPSEKNYEITLNYSCLRPASSYSVNSNVKNTNSQINQLDNTFESKSLLYMAQNNELKSLLKHPIISSFLYLKWQKIYKWFCINLLFYFVFLVAMTCYIIDEYSNPDSKRNESDATPNSEHNFCWLILVFLFVILILREAVQLLIAPCEYLVSPENWLEIVIIATSVKVILFSENTSFEDKVKLSVVTIMLSWSEFVLLIGRHPALSTYIEMLKTVSKNFFKFLAWYFVLIFAFSLSFYIIFRMQDHSSSMPTTNNSMLTINSSISPTNSSRCYCSKDKNDDEEDLFGTPVVSLFKTVIMLTGEFDASSMPFTAYPGYSHILFIAFLFFISIVLFNLLNGLAVSDTQSIRSDSELVGYISRVNLVAYIETFVCNPLPNTRAVFNSNICASWKSHFSYYRNKLTSYLTYYLKDINLFQNDLSKDPEIRILPNDDNLVEMGNVQSSAIRKESATDQRCYTKCGCMRMDSIVLHDIKAILLAKHAEKELTKLETNKQKQERLLFEMIEECRDRIKAIEKKVCNIDYNI